MTRARVDYSQRTDVRVAGFDPDQPVAGFYRIRLRSGAAFAGVYIWHGLPLDPVTGEELDRSPRWQASLNGEAIDLERVWPRCADEPITEANYRHLCRTQQWARENAPDSALADPRKPIDLLSTSTPLPF